MKYKVYDKVRVVLNEATALQNDNREHACGFNSDMETLCDTIVTILEVREHFYRIKEDAGSWSWAEGFFVGLAEEEKKPIKTSKEEKEDIANMLFDRIYTTAKFDTDKGINIFKHDMEILREFVNELIEEK